MMSGVGIDVSKAWLDVAWSACDRRLRVANTSVGWKVLVQAMADDPHVRIVLEASGGYEQGLLDYLVQAGHWVCRINPRQARDFAKALGQLAKTDTLDARVLAQMAATIDTLSPYRSLTAAQRELSQWVRRRAQLVQMIQCDVSVLPCSASRSCAAGHGGNWRRYRASWAGSTKASVRGSRHCRSFASWRGRRALGRS